jgi:hypothetical protein
MSCHDYPLTALDTNGGCGRGEVDTNPPNLQPIYYIKSESWVSIAFPEAREDAIMMLPSTSEK